MSTAPMILFTNAVPDVFRRSDIYDSTLHGTDYVNSGKQIPSPESLVVDDVTSPGSLSLWVVESVDLVTRNSTIVPIRLSYDITDRVTNYGNEMLCVYYETIADAYGYRLTLDSKILMFGTSDAYYILYRRRDGVDTVVSNYYTEAGELDGHYIPLQEVDVTTGAKLFQSCVTGEVLEDGDVIIMQVYTLKVTTPPTLTPVYELVSEYKLIAKEAHQLESLVIGEGPIVGMSVTANQMTEDGKLIIYRGQSMSELVINPFILYANGQEEPRPIDNDICFVYGLDDVITTAIDSEYNITVKCFIPDNYPSPLQDGAISSRSVAKTLQLVVKARDVDEVLKLSPIPLLVDTVRTIRYIDSRISRTIPTGYVTIEYTTDEINPILYGVNQTVGVRYTTEDALGIAYQYDQEYGITLVDGLTDDKWWIITDESSGTQYGRTDGGGAFYVPHVNILVDVCTIPIAVFTTVESFIANFYTRAYPPKLVLEGAPPTPTHFNLRYASTYALINVTPISVLDYATGVACVGATLIADDTIVVEFLRQVGETTSYLYSVPAVVLS
jgi:hypothetical protein